MKKKIYMEERWQQVLMQEFEKPYMQELRAFLVQEKAKKQTIYPPSSLVFNAFNQTPYDSVKVVIVGQDPYHGEGQAHGLSFSVPEGVAIPPSLRNIYQELVDDLGIQKPTTGCLLPWAKQGVLLLNATLTVRAKSPCSHFQKGWEKFTDNVVEKLAMRKDPIVFLLWGKNAQEKCQHIVTNYSQHLVLCASHPSFFSASRGFFGCRHFSKTNTFLQRAKKEPINW